MAGVEVIIGANTDDLDRAVKRSKSQINQLSREMKAGIKQAAKYGAAAAAAGAAIAIGLTVKGLAAVDAQAKLARQIGGTIDGLRATQIAASDAGIGLSIMNDAAEKLNQRIGESARGTGTAAASFKRLGLDASALGDMDVDERMAAIADRMKEMGLSTSAAADELRQMGIRNGELVNLMLQGGDAIRGARTEVEALGLSLSDVDAAKVEAANDSFARVGLVVEGISQHMAIEFAPILDAVSKMMVEAGTDGVDMGEAVGNGFDMVVNAIAFVVDAVAGVNRVLLVAGKGAALFGLGMAEVMLMIADYVINKPVKAMNELIELMNKIPGVDIETAGLSTIGKTIEQELEIVRAAQRTGMQDIQDTLTAPMPGMEFKRFVAESKANAQAAAEEMVSVSALLRPDIGGGEDDDEDPEAKKKASEDLERRLEAIKEANMSERELTLEKYAIENEDLALALEQQMITKEEWGALSVEQKQREEDELTAIEERAASERTKIKEREARQKAAAEKQFWSDTTSLMNSGSRTMFKIGKAAALSQAVVDGYAAITGAYKIGASTGGPWLGAAYGAAAAAATFSQISAIKSSSFGGGGSGGGGGGGGSVTQSINDQSEPVKSTAEPTEKTVANLSITGQNFDRRTVIGLVEQINDLQEDGMRIKLNTV